MKSIYQIIDPSYVRASTSQGPREHRARTGEPDFHHIPHHVRERGAYAGKAARREVRR